MGVSEGFEKASHLIRLTIVLLFLGSVSNWIAFCTTSWSSQTGRGFGLWRYCDESNPCTMMDGTRRDWFAGVQFCEVAGFTGLNVASLLIVLYMFKNSCFRNGEVRVGIILGSFVGFAGHLTAVIVFGVLRLSLYWSADGEKLGFSYGFAVAASFFGLVSAIACFIDVFVSPARSETPTKGEGYVNTSL